MATKIERSWMTLKEYRKFIEERGFKEEEGAVEVVKEICRTLEEEWRKKVGFYPDHAIHNLNDFNLELYPRKVVGRGKDRIEFDLLIVLRHIMEKKVYYTIGIEFKEEDLDEVISQAIVRRPFVDYMYIATPARLSIDYQQLILLCYLGIGWVVYFPNDQFRKNTNLSSAINNAKTLLRSRRYWEDGYHRLVEILEMFQYEKLGWLDKWWLKRKKRKAQKLDRWLK